MNVAVILAGGKGVRMGADLPKQFLKLSGKKVIEHTIEAFEQNPAINEIIIVSNETHKGLVKRLINANNYQKVKKVLIGGKERHHSSLAAIDYCSDGDNLFIHDSVRPLISQQIINDCAQAITKYKAVNVGIPPTDTIYSVNNNREMTLVHPRNELRHGQSPQVFKREIIKRAYEIALKDPDFTTTDDCGVILKYLPEVPIFVVDGEVTNMKLTYKEDVALLEKFLKMNQK
jgi:2-C-methyl-D-erythritol 4-phosphate cytidylyltransferase